MNRNTLILSIVLILASFQVSDITHFKSNEGVIQFISEAPLEVISASSNSLRGIIDTSTNKFAFSVTVNTFHGFNSSLQQQHFNENYMESGIFPNATFTGKIIEEVNYSINSSQQVRAKGELNIHGVKQERLIKANLKIENNEILVDAVFDILLADHGIKIPRIVHQKISPEIKVEVKAKLVQSN